MDHPQEPPNDTNMSDYPLTTIHLTNPQTKERHIYHMHTSLLVHRSLFFKYHLMHHDPSTPINLPYLTDPSIFAVFEAFINLTTFDICLGLQNSNSIEDIMSVCVESWLLGQTLGTPSFMNKVMKSILYIVHRVPAFEGLSSGCPFTTRMALHIWKHTGPVMCSDCWKPRPNELHFSPFKWRNPLLRRLLLATLAFICYDLEDDAKLAFEEQWKGVFKECQGMKPQIDQLCGQDEIAIGWKYFLKKKNPNEPVEFPEFKSGDEDMESIVEL